MESFLGIVQTSEDALLLLEASRLSLIPRIKRRLKDRDRENIRPGQIFTWNEHETKMRRWTDGRSWSASRVTGTFLTYREMETKDGEATSYSYKSNGLIKQSFSITTKQGQKWHLISYTTTRDFSKDKLLNKCPSKDPAFDHITIPESIYPHMANIKEMRSSSTSEPSTKLNDAKLSVPTPLTSPVLSINLPESPLSLPELPSQLPISIMTLTPPSLIPRTTITPPLLKQPPLAMQDKHLGTMHRQRHHSLPRLHDDDLALRYLDSMSFR